MAKQKPDPRSVVRIPLAGSFNQRTIDGESTLDAEQDQRFLNCTFRVVKNPITDKETVYVEKRTGWAVDSVVSAGNQSTRLIKTAFLGSAVSAFGTTNSTLFDGTVSIGAITGRALHMSETLINTTGYVLIKSSDGTGWYYASDAKTQTSYTGNTTNASAVVTGIPSTTGMYSGQAISGTNIQAGARILTVDSATQITMTLTATGTSGTTITKTPVAKILDADFASSTTSHSAFISMDGYIFYTTDDGKLRNSDLNSVKDWSATSFLSTAFSADPAVAVSRYKNLIIVFGSASWEAFYNADTASGSPLGRVAHVSASFGTPDQRSIATLHDDIYFLTSARYGEVGVIRLKDMASTDISTPEIRRILGTSSSSGGTTYLNAFQLGGHDYISCSTLTSSEDPDDFLLESGEFLLLENNDNVLLEGSGSESAVFGRMLVYNTDLNIWSEWDTDLATSIVGGVGMVNEILATSRVDTGGKVFKMRPASDGDIYTDDGSVYDMEIRTSKLDFGTEKRKFIHSISLVADEESSGEVLLECSDDDYQTWRTLGTFDLTNNRKRIPAAGSHRGGRAYRLTHSDAAPFRAQALEFELTEGTL